MGLILKQIPKRLTYLGGKKPDYCAFLKYAFETANRLCIVTFLFIYLTNIYWTYTVCHALC